MAILTQLQGVAGIVRNLNAAQKKLSDNFAKSVKVAGLTLQRESQKLVPVNFGVLKASAYTRAKGEGFKTVVNVGYTAFYALYVHEAVNMKLKGLPRPNNRGKYWDPQGKAQAKFLEEPYRRLRPQLLAIIRDGMKL